MGWLNRMDTTALQKSGVIQRVRCVWLSEGTGARIGGKGDYTVGSLLVTPLLLLVSMSGGIHLKVPPSVCSCATAKKTLSCMLILTPIAVTTSLNADANTFAYYDASRNQATRPSPQPWPITKRKSISEDVQPSPTKVDSLTAVSCGFRNESREKTPNT